MLVANISTIIKDFNKTCDSVIQNCEPIIVTRQDNNNVVIISQAEYDNMLENIYVRKSSANYKHIIESINQAKHGNLTTLDIGEEND